MEIGAIYNMMLLFFGLFVVIGITLLFVHMGVTCAV